MYYWRKINIILFVALLVFLIPSIYSLLTPGFIITDDASWMVIRLSAFYDTLRDGQIPARVLERLNNGYGYPVANFLYPGFLYIGSIIHILGFGFIDSVKIILVLSMIGSGIFSYFWLKKVFDPFAAFIGSIFYVYSPYHLYDLYTRGSVGEILAFAWVPFILWQLERKSLSFASLGIFLLIISHNSLALLFLPFIIVYGLLLRNYLLTIGSVALGLLMSAYFIIPAIFELSLTTFSSIEISDPTKYFAPIPLVGYSTLVVIGVLVVVLIAIKDSIRTMPRKSQTMLFIFFLLMSIILSTQLSESIWRVIPSQFIQFPYRILSILLIAIAFISAFIVSKGIGKVKIIVSVLMLSILVYSSYGYIFSVEKNYYPDEYYSTNMDTTTVKNEYMPKWVKRTPEKMPDKKIEVIDGSAVIVKSSINSRKVVIDLENSKDSTVRINHIYYPGWKAFMNNERIQITYDNEFGVMDIPIQRAGGRVTAVFEETPLRYISNVISVLSFVFLIYLWLKPILKFK